MRRVVRGSKWVPVLPVVQPLCTACKGVPPRPVGMARRVRARAASGLRMATCAWACWLNIPPPCARTPEDRENEDQTQVLGLDKAVLLHDPQATGSWGISAPLQQRSLKQTEAGCSLEVLSRHNCSHTWPGPSWIAARAATPKQNQEEYLITGNPMNKKTQVI